jgi:uncharacterized phage-associated protein
MASENGRSLSDTTLHSLVYIANGECLFSSACALTFDAPETGPSGPIFRRLENALAQLGIRSAGQQLKVDALTGTRPFLFGPVNSPVDEVERDIVSATFRRWAGRSLSELSVVTQGDNSPWKALANEEGIIREISRLHILHQFSSPTGGYGRNFHARFARANG